MVIPRNQRAYAYCSQRHSVVACSFTSIGGLHINHRMLSSDLVDVNECASRLLTRTSCAGPWSPVSRLLLQLHQSLLVNSEVSDKASERLVQR